MSDKIGQLKMQVMTPEGHNSDQSNTPPVDWQSIAREQSRVLTEIDRLSTGWKHGMEGVHLLRIHELTRSALKGGRDDAASVSIRPGGIIKAL